MITPEERSTLEILLTLAGILFGLGFWIRRKEQAARHWPQAPGVIVTSIAQFQYAGNGRSEVLPVIEYEFAYKGRSFKTSHWRLLDFSVGSSESAEAVTSRYPIDSPVTVFVNTRHPMKSVLEYQPSALCWVPFGFSILFIALSTLILLVSLSKLQR